MSKRNFILLIIVLIIIIAIIFGFFYFYKSEDKNGKNSEVINFLADFLPFGKSKTTTPTDTTNPTDVSGYDSPDVLSYLKLKKISTFPVAGFTVFNKERFKGETVENQPTTITPTAPATEFVPALRYVDKITGNIYQTFADKIDERKFSSTVIPKVYEAYFSNKGESVIMRYLKNEIIETFVGALQKEYLGADSVGTNEIKGSFLPENISNLSISPDTSKVFYLFKIGENIVGVTFSPQTSTKIQVFDSPFTEWLTFWPNDKLITVTTKPSATVPGYMYAINPDRKDFNKILGGINGLTTLTSPNGKIVLYSDNNLSLSTFNIDTRNSTSLGLKTLPEKCVWGVANDVVYCAVPKFTNQAQYPDSWYQGEISFSDEIWKIDVESGDGTIVLDPTSEENGEEIDGIKLSLDENQNYLFFVNKKDSSLWELQLK